MTLVWLFLELLISFVLLKGLICDRWVTVGLNFKKTRNFTSNDNEEIRQKVEELEKGKKISQKKKFISCSDGLVKGK